MTLRDFIEQERRECHIFDIEEFGEKLKSLKWEDGEEIEPKEFENYVICINGIWQPFGVIEDD